MSESTNKHEVQKVLPPKAQNQLQFSDIWKGIVKFWFLAVALGLLTCSASFLFSYSSFRPQYTVSTTFTVNTETLSLTGEGIPSYSFVYDNATATQLADTFPYILSSNILQEAICDDLNSTYVPASLSAYAVSSTNMFTLTAVGSTAEDTYNVCLSAMENYPVVAKYLVGNVKLSVITEPEYPSSPSNQFTYNAALKGFGLGFGIGVLWILAYAYFRATIKTRHDIHEKLHLEVLGILPEVSFKKYKNEEIDTSILFTNDKIGKGFLESMRLFRNTFQNLLKEEEKVVMATSTAPGEGKTTAIVNLSLALADVNKRVLLVDCDLRNPSVEPLLNLPTQEELSDDEMYRVIKTDYDNVDFLKFSHGKGKYWQILRVEYLTELFNKYKDDYDYILVDTPPCGLVSDTVSIAQCCDAAIYVVLQDTVRTKKVLEGLDSVLATNARVIGAVMNGAQSGLAGYGDDYGYGYGDYGHYKNYSRYGYGYGYGYGYSYGNEKTDGGK